MSVEIDLLGDASADSAGNPADQPAAAPSSEGCPTPLGWAEVLESFRADSTAWSVDVDGASVHGRTLGRGRPLYFLNGITGNCELFCLLAWLLRDEFRCVLFDYSVRECGGSRQPSLARLSKELLAAADAQGDKVICAFAAPFGGLVLLNALLEHHQRFERAVLLGAFAHRRLSRFERLLCGVGHYLQGDLSRIPVRSTLQQASHQRAFPPFDATRWDFFAQNTSQTAVHDLADRAAMMASCDLRGRLSRIEQPVLLLKTEHEGAISAAGQEKLERELPHARSESIPLAGQLAYLTHPHRVAKAVRSFLGEAGLPDGSSCGAIRLDNSCCADHKDESP